MPEIPPPQPNTPERSRPPKPSLPLDVRVAIAETERKVKRLLEDIPTIPGFIMLESDVVNATNVMRGGVPEAFKMRADYYASQSGYCRAWLDEAADETVAAMLSLIALWTFPSYRESVPSIRKELRRILQAQIDERLNCMNHVDTQKSEPPAELAAFPRRGIVEKAMAKPKTIESLKAGIDDDIKALITEQRSTLTWEQQMMWVSPPPRTFNLNDPFEANLFSVLERGARDLTESASAEAVWQGGDEVLRPSKRSAITEPIHSFLADRWLNTGVDLLQGFPGARLRVEPTLSRLRAVVNRTLMKLSLARERAGGPAGNARSAVPAPPATLGNAETQLANDPHRSEQPDGAPQAVEEPGSSDKVGTADVIRAPEIPGGPSRSAAYPLQGIAKAAMAERPVLPLETRAAIERTVAKVLSIRSDLFPHLFSPVIRGSLGPHSAVEEWPIHRKPATLKTELQDYAFMLFMAEAGHYPRHAHDESELLSWLSSLASCVEAEVITETDQWSHLFNSHCSALERRLAIAERLKQWIDSQDADGLKRWIDKQRREEASGDESPPVEAVPVVNGATGNGADLVTAERKAQQDRIRIPVLGNGTRLESEGEPGITEESSEGAARSTSAADRRQTRREKRKRGIESDDSGHKRVAEILADYPQWAENLKEACVLLANPPDGKPAPAISQAWRHTYKITGYGEVYENIGEKEIRQHLARRLDLGRELLARNSRQ